MVRIFKKPFPGGGFWNSEGETVINVAGFGSEWYDFHAKVRGGQIFQPTLKSILESANDQQSFLFVLRWLQPKVRVKRKSGSKRGS
jgi:hypothetical protein